MTGHHRIGLQIKPHVSIESTIERNLIIDVEEKETIDMWGTDQKSGSF